MIIPTQIQILLGISTLFYAVVVIGLLAGIRRLHYHPSQSKPHVSVIVAARNEEENIGFLLDHLVRQDYPDFEVIIVNDRSTDQSTSIVERFQQQYPFVRLINVDSVPYDMPPKKNALAQGVASSKGEILCFTDADCFPPPQWVSSIVAAFDHETGLVAGYSPYSAPLTTNGTRSQGALWLRKFIEYEEFKGATWAAGAIGMKKAWLCTGRSLAYRRVVYDELGGFERIKRSVSGDDDLFLQLVRLHTSWKIRYATNPASFVPTMPPSTFGAFLQQRVRHFSAGKFFPFSMKAFFFAFHASNALILGALAVAIVSGFSTALVWPYVAKCIIDAVLFLRAAPLFGQMKFWSSFLFMESLYVLYNSFIGPLGFMKRYEWKPSKRP
ncbi:MAG: glycosyltransferase [Ignavibacteriales bacterium]|nr:glycosyltransferase [Ignavibacteriales bacterium]